MRFDRIWRSMYQLPAGWDRLSSGYSESTSPQVCSQDALPTQPRGETYAAPRQSSSSSRHGEETVATHQRQPGTTDDSAARLENSSHILNLYSEELPSFVRPVATVPHSPLYVFLRSKGVLSAPPLPLRKALWLAYLRTVHPSLPVLQVRHVSTILFGNEGSQPKFSLLLFHAIMFAGMHTVDMSYLIDAGYSSRKACIHECFEIVKVWWHSIFPAVFSLFLC